MAVVSVSPAGLEGAVISVEAESGKPIVLKPSGSNVKVGQTVINHGDTVSTQTLPSPCHIYGGYCAVEGSGHETTYLAHWYELQGYRCTRYVQYRL